jgi:hypothetical protein
MTADAAPVTATTSIIVPDVSGHDVPPLVSDLTLARLCADTYAPGAVPTWNTPNVHAFLTMQDGYSIVCFRGSASTQDWLQNFKAFVVEGSVPNAKDHICLGLVHDAWFGEVATIFETMVKEIPMDPIIISGHSKGSSDGLYLAAMLLAATNRNVAKVTTFGTPRPGRLNGLLSRMPGKDYRNRNDPVCEVPPYLHHPRLITPLDAAPMADDPWGLLADHHVNLYIEGVAKLEGQT